MNGTTREALPPLNKRTPELQVERREVTSVKASYFCKGIFSLGYSD